MKPLIVISTLLFFSSCCCKYDNKDFEFTAAHNDLLKPYNQSDTICFISSSGDMDTITISKIDLFQECGCFMSGSRKRITVEIKHVPNSKWITGTEHPQTGPSRIIDQQLIVIEKSLDLNDSMYFIGINYRNLMGQLTDLSKTDTDNRFEKFGIKNYWTILNQAANTDPYKNDSTTVIKAFWTKEFGLTGYELRNGTSYEIHKKSDYEKK